MASVFPKVGGQQRGFAFSPKVRILRATIPTTNRETAMDFTEIRRDDGITVLKLEGRMDIDGADAVSKRLIAATSDRGMRVIADLAEVNFMSSIGIGMMVRLAQHVRKHRGNLVLLDPQSVVWLVLERTRIPDIITVHLTLDEALKAVWDDPPTLPGQKP